MWTVGLVLVMALVACGGSSGELEQRVGNFPTVWQFGAKIFIGTCSLFPRVGNYAITEKSPLGFSPGVLSGLVCQ